MRLAATFVGGFWASGQFRTGVGIILDNLAKDNKDNAKFYLYLYLR